MRGRNSERGRQDDPGTNNDKPQKIDAPPRKDFWDAIADDVASGYRKGNRGHGIFNEDQQRDDNRRGDEVA